MSESDSASQSSYSAGGGGAVAESADARQLNDFNERCGALLRHDEAAWREAAPASQSRPGAVLRACIPAANEVLQRSTTSQRDQRPPVHSHTHPDLGVRPLPAGAGTTMTCWSRAGR